MQRLTANPNAEASSGFDVVRPSVYRMRIKEVLYEDSNGKPFVSEKRNTCWRVRFEYVDKLGLINLQGQAAKNPGTLTDNGLVVDPPEGQGKIRGLVEACGRPWQDYDPWELHGWELDVKVGTEPWEGEQRNKIQRYMPIK